MTHVFSARHKNAPNEACHRALVQNPFTCKEQCEASGVPYNCCKIPDPWQMRPTKLIETITQDTIKCSDTGFAAFSVMPSLTYLAESNDGANLFTSGTVDHLPNAEWPTLLANYSIYRVVAMGLEVSPVSSLMNIAGTVSMAPAPAQAFPFTSYPTYGAPTSIAQVQALDNSAVGPVNQSMHCAWIPDSNLNVPVNNSSGVVYSASWRYDNWQPIGYTQTGAKATTIATMSDMPTLVQGLVVSGQWPQHQLKDLASSIVCVIEGAENSGVGQSFIIKIVQHLELIALTRGTGLGAGSLGRDIKAHQGLVARVEGDAKWAWHELGKVAGVATSAASGAWHVGKDIAKIGGLIAGGLALL